MAHLSAGHWMIIAVTIGLALWCLTGPASTRTPKKRRKDK